MKISYVIPCYCSAKTLPMVIDEIDATMAKLSDYTYELILVNDASPDDTFDYIRELSKKRDDVIGIDMAKNFGQHGALMAGFHAVTGDILCCLDDDGQTPADEVGSLLAKLDEGYDVVYASYESKKHSWFRNFGSSVNRVMTEQLLNKPKSLFMSSYFVARRFVVDEMLRYENAFPYVPGLVLRTTKRITHIPVKHRAREIGTSGYSFKKLLGLWMNGFTAFSVKPLRVATYSGVALAIAGLVYAIIQIVKYFSLEPTPEGWTSTIAILLIVGGMILFVLGMIGEYIGRIYICMNNSPQYVIREQVGVKE